MKAAAEINTNESLTDEMLNSLSILVCVCVCEWIRVNLLADQRSYISLER